MENQWKTKIDRFIELVNEHSVRMLMVNGGAVNFHGYQRHSADADFWIAATTANFKKLVAVFRDMDYDIDDFPDDVKNQLKNISVKFSPEDLNLELITKFSTTTSFKDAFARSKKATIKGNPILKWRVLSYEDLIASKLKAIHKSSNQK